MYQLSGSTVHLFLTPRSVITSFISRVCSQGLTFPWFVVSAMMEEDKTYQRWKNYLIIVNILFEICGAIVVFIGFYTLLRSSSTNGMLTAILFIVGAIIMVIAMLGYMGAHKENPELLKIYGWVVIVLLVLKMCGFIYFILNPIHYSLDSNFKKIYEYYDENPSITAKVDMIQRTHYCCGYDGPQSMVRLDGTYPSSCCTSSQTTCFLPYPDGCSSKILGTLSPILTVSRGFSYFGFVTHLFCVFGAFNMASSIKSKRSTGSKLPYNNF
ncbi:hypothetical protein Trydic_g17698 [Trypoxylus dichotomus]